LVLEATSLGSLEYAVAHLHVPLLVIKGHESCGAVTATVEHPDLEESHITAVVQKIAPAAARARESGLTGSDLVEAANNLHLAALHDTLRRESPIIGEALASDRLHIVVTKYSLQAGQVDVLDTTW
jgi:carbonic anhydrase